MKLAERIEIAIGGEVVPLRPSLRYALRLVGRPGSFAAILGEISDGSLTAAADIIGDHYQNPFLHHQIMDAGLDKLREPLTLYVMALAGIDPNDAPKRKPKGKAKSVPFKDHLEHLYRVGTGWLGWTPETTLDATPLEIQLAYEGRLEMLNAIFGGTTQDTEPADLNDKIKSAFTQVGTTKISRKNRPHVSDQ